MNRKINFIFLILFVGCLSSVFSDEKADALVLYQRGLYQESIAVCEQEIQSNPNRIESYVVMCWSLVKNKQYAEAEIRATAGLKINPYDVRLLEILGEAKYYLGNYKGAIEQFQKFFSNAPENHPRMGVAYYLMGKIYIKQERYLHADIAFSTAVKKDATNDKWWTELGYAREMSKDYAKAADAYERALKINPSSINASKGRTRVHQKIQ